MVPRYDRIRSFSAVIQTNYSLLEIRRGNPRPDLLMQEVIMKNNTQILWKLDLAYEALDVPPFLIGREFSFKIHGTI